MTQEISLYFHIPFCTKKCDYCHFFVLPNKESLHEQLIEALRMEWDLYVPKIQGNKLVSVYFGGGTPALIGPSKIGEILSWIENIFPDDLPHAEITLEANPENITLPIMKKFQNVGINRVSIGVQTLDEPTLYLLGRTHTSNKALDAVKQTYEAGITNISIDLMYDLPGQTLQQWSHTLERAAKLPITHLSLYNLTIEPHTVFFKYRDALQKRVPDPEISTQMYEMAINVLEASGLRQYEISAFARNGLHSRHNTGYWLARPFIGFGPSAFSHWEGQRFRNIAHLNKYHKSLKEGILPIDFSEELDPNAARREKFVIQLRLREGIHLKKFSQLYGELDQETLEKIDELVKIGWISKEKERILLTKKGLLFYDSVASELI